MVITQSRRLSPMLATLTHETFSHPDWLFETKLDGQRFLAFRDGDDVRLMSRNRKDISRGYPELVAAFAEQDADDFVVDGEIVAFEDGRTSFAALQPRMQAREPRYASRWVEIYAYLFDLLRLDGRDTTRLPLRERKRLLADAISFTDPLRYSEHREADGEAYHREACERGWEGVIAKRADSPYVQSRSTDWLKFTCVSDQELVIGGFTDPSGSRRGFGALLVGYYDNDALVYAGKVGTGYNERTLADLRRRMDDLEQPESPFTGEIRQPGVHWVRPELVGQFGFTEWTRDGRLRHPRFKGLRRDKPACDVRRETPGA